MGNSYLSRLLRVDLSKGRWCFEPLNSDWVELYYGGRGLGARYLLDELSAKIDPLSPDNRLIFMTGPFTGTVTPNAGKLEVLAKSPATGTILDCSIGGSIGSAIKFTGFDGIIIQGKAKKPVYILIDKDKISICDASGLWGKGSHETETQLRKQLGEEVSVISIGPAGENLVPFSCLTSEYYRQAGRGGIGAVMGSKNLKAVVVKGSKGVTVPNIKEFLKEVKQIMENDVLPTTQWAYENGTTGLVYQCHKAGILPTRNYRYGQFEGQSSLNHEAVKQNRKRKKACVGCPVGCGNFIKVGNTTLEGPEFETIALCGSNCGISDLEAVSEFNKLCDNLGLDSISTGNVVGLAMDMTERGIHDFGIRFGDVEKYLEAPKLIAFKKDIGVELALGSRELAKKYKAEKLAMEVKGLELPGYEPRGSWGMGLAYATSDRGGCHMRAFTVGREALGNLDPFTIEGKAAITIEKQDYNAIKWSLPICDFWAVDYKTMAKLMSLALNKDFTESDMKTAGERIYNLTRMFNVIEGFRRDELPSRVFDEPLEGEGPAKGKVIPRDEFEKMLDEYYQLRGWNQDGIPSKEKLLELSIDQSALDKFYANIRKLYS